MKTRDRMYAVCGGLCLVVALLWGIASFQNNNPIYQKVGPDNGIFLSMGKGIVEGLTPYVDITENKGPLFFLLMALPQAIIEGSAGIYALELLNMFGICILILICARWLQREYSILAAVAAIYVYLSSSAIDSNFCEEYDLFFLLLGVAVLLHALMERTRGEKWRAFILGVATAGIALIKISDILGLGVTVLFYLAYVIREKKNVWHEALRYFAGLAVICLPVFFYLWRVDAIGPMLREYILNNFDHVESAKDVGFWEIRRYIFKGSYGWLSVFPVLLTAAAAAMRLAVRRVSRESVKHEAMLLIYASTFSVANMLGAYVAGTGFHQHLVMGVATKVLACLLGLSALLKIINSRLAWMIWPERAIALALGLMLAIPSIEMLMPERLEQAKAEKKERFEVQQEFLTELEGCETVYTIGVVPVGIGIRDISRPFATIILRHLLRIMWGKVWNMNLKNLSCGER